MLGKSVAIVQFCKALVHIQFFFLNLFYMFNANVFKILLLYNIFAWQPSMVKPVTVLATLRQQQLVGAEQVVYSGTL